MRTRFIGRSRPTGRVQFIRPLDSSWSRLATCHRVSLASSTNRVEVDAAGSPVGGTCSRATAPASRSPRTPYLDHGGMQERRNRSIERLWEYRPYESQAAPQEADPSDNAYGFEGLLSFTFTRSSLTPSRPAFVNVRDIPPLVAA